MSFQVTKTKYQALWYKAGYGVILEALQEKLNTYQYDENIILDDRFYYRWRIGINHFKSGYLIKSIEALEALWKDIQAIEDTKQRYLITGFTINHIATIHRTIGRAAIFQFLNDDQMKTLAELNPNKYHHHNNQNNQHQKQPKQQHLEVAHAHYQYAIDHLKLDLTAMFELPKILLEYGQILEYYGAYESAIQTYAKILSNFPNSPKYFDALYRTAVVGHYLAYFALSAASTVQGAAQGGAKEVKDKMVKDKREIVDVEDDGNIASYVSPNQAQYDTIDQCIDIFQFLLEALPVNIIDYHIILCYARCLEISNSPTTRFRAQGVYQTLYDILKKKYRNTFFQDLIIQYNTDNNTEPSSSAAVEAAIKAWPAVPPPPTTAASAVSLHTSGTVSPLTAANIGISSPASLMLLPNLQPWMRLGAALEQEGEFLIAHNAFLKFTEEARRVQPPLPRALLAAATPMQPPSSAGSAFGALSPMNSSKSNRKKPPTLSSTTGIPSLLTVQDCLQLALHFARSQLYDKAVYYLEVGLSIDRYHPVIRDLLHAWSAEHAKELSEEAQAAKRILLAWKSRCWQINYILKLKKHTVETLTKRLYQPVRRSSSLNNSSNNSNSNGKKKANVIVPANLTNYYKDVEARKLLAYYQRDQYRPHFLFEEICAKRIQQCFREYRAKSAWRENQRAALASKALEAFHDYQQKPFDYEIRERCKKIVGHQPSSSTNTPIATRSYAANLLSRKHPIHLIVRQIIQQDTAIVLMQRLGKVFHRKLQLHKRIQYRKQQYYQSRLVYILAMQAWIRQKLARIHVQAKRLLNFRQKQAVACISRVWYSHHTQKKLRRVILSLSEQEQRKRNHAFEKLKKLLPKVLRRYFMKRNIQLLKADQRKMKAMQRAKDLQQSQEIFLAAHVIQHAYRQYRARFWLTVASRLFIVRSKSRYSSLVDKSGSFYIPPNQIMNARQLAKYMNYCKAQRFPRPSRLYTMALSDMMIVNNNNKEAAAAMGLTSSAKAAGKVVTEYLYDAQRHGSLHEQAMIILPSYACTPIGLEYHHLALALSHPSCLIQRLILLDNTSFTHDTRAASDAATALAAAAAATSSPKANQPPIGEQQPTLQYAYHTQFLQALQHCKSIRSLWILGGTWHSNAIKTLFTLVQTDNPRIIEVAIERISIIQHRRSETISILAQRSVQLLQDYFNYTLPGIQSLSLHGCHLSDEQMSSLAAGLSVNASLQCLYLSLNIIGDDGFLTLLQDGLQKNKTHPLLLLDLSCNLIVGGPKVIAALHAYRHHNLKHLTRIDLSYNRMLMKFDAMDSAIMQRIPVQLEIIYRDDDHSHHYTQKMKLIVNKPAAISPKKAVTSKYLEGNANSVLVGSNSSSALLFPPSAAMKKSNSVLEGSSNKIAERSSSPPWLSSSDHQQVNGDHHYRSQSQKGDSAWAMEMIGGGHHHHLHNPLQPHANYHLSSRAKQEQTKHAYGDAITLPGSMKGAKKKK